MATEELIFRIFGLRNFLVPADKEVIIANTTLLDTFGINAHGVIVLHDWSLDLLKFFMNLLHYEEDELKEYFDKFEAKVEDVWSIASFHEKFIQQSPVADDDLETSEPAWPTLRLRQWFCRWWKENGQGFRGERASDLSILVMPAFYIGDAETFASVTHAWFLHTNGKQAQLIRPLNMPLDSDQGGLDVINTKHPLLGKLEAVRTNMIGKIEDALPYNEERDGLPRGLGNRPAHCDDPIWCRILKLNAYHKALKATGCWPVRDQINDHSILEILTMITERFNYVNYDDRKDVPHRDVAKAHLPPSQGATNGKRCTVCVDAVVKSSFDRKVKSLIKTLLDEKKTWVTVEQDGQTVRKQVDDSFVGLCLDCLTKSKFENEDADYWNHCLEFEYDKGCTIAHGQPTWYFSYLGRPEALRSFLREKKALSKTTRGPSR